MDKGFSENKRSPVGFPFGLYAAALLLIIAAGRAVMFAFNQVSVDVSYAPWVSDVLQAAADILNGAKNALGYAGIGFCLWNISEGVAWRAFGVFAAGLFLENVIRFLIDYFSSGLSYYGIPLTLVTLGLRFLYEAGLALALVGIVTLFRRMARKREGESRCFTRCLTVENGVRAGLLLVMAAQLLSEVLYVVDYFTVYAEMSPAEISACVGSFLSILVMYGGVPLLLAEGAFLLLKKNTVQSNT